MDCRGVAILDFDGTLVDSQNRNNSFRYWSAIAGAISERTKGFFDPLRDFAALATGIGLHYPLICGVAETLKALRSREVLLVLFTDRPAWAVERFFHFNLEINLGDFCAIRTTQSFLDRFVQLPSLHVSHNDGKNGFHLKEVIALLRWAYGFDTEKFVLVGDHEVDFRAASSADIAFRASTWGKLSADEFRVLGVPESHLLGSFFDLLEFFD